MRAPEDQKGTAPQRLTAVATTGLFVLVLVYALRVASELVLPLVFGVLLASLLAPIVRGLRHRARVPAPLGALLALALAGAALGYSVYALSVPTRDWIEQISHRWPEVRQKLERVKEPLDQIGRASEEIEELTGLTDRDQRIELEPGTRIDLLGRGWKLTVSLLIVLVLAYFLLASLDSFLGRLVHVLPRIEQKKRAVEVTRLIQEGVSRYLVTITLINIGLGLAVGVAVGIAGLPNPALWGAVAGLFNFVPYLGAAVGTSLLLLVSAITFESTLSILLPSILYTSLNLTEAYLITPAILGRRASMSPVVIFVSVLVFTWMWGIPGAFLAVPLIMSMRIAFSHIPAMTPLAAMLGTGPGDVTDFADSPEPRE